MAGGSEGFNGRTLPAAIVIVTGTCVKRAAGEKRPFVYSFVGANDKEFDMFRATAWAASLGEQPSPRERSFNEHVSQYFRAN
jgi:hypothetical protein